MTLIIDSDNYEAAGITTMFFPGGEPHVKVPMYPDGEDIVFVGKMRKWDDVGMAALVLNVLGHQYDRGGLNLRVFIPYFPGARQDKASGMAPYTIGVMTRLLYDERIAEIAVFDIHSNQALNTLLAEGGVTNIMPDALPLKDMIAGPVTGVIAPDTGAIRRADRMARQLEAKHSLQCSKVRDQETGHILHYNAPKLPEPGHYLVVDDICDGGATFNLLADALGRDPIGRRSTFSLYVSHGIFSKGLTNIDPLYRQIYTTDSWCQQKMFARERLTVIPLLPTYLNRSAS